MCSCYDGYHGWCCLNRSLIDKGRNGEVEIKRKVTLLRQIKSQYQEKVFGQTLVHMTCQLDPDMQSPLPGNCKVTCF